MSEEKALTGLSLQTKAALLHELEEKLGQALFQRWCKKFQFVPTSENALEVPVPNKYYQEFVEKEFRQPLEETFLKVTGVVPTIIFKVAPQMEDLFIEDAQSVSVASASSPSTTIPSKPRLGELTLNDHYTFENFVVGPSNALAHAGAVAVSEYPGRKYNPLFIYGSVGLGKTHLLQAACRELLRKNPECRIIYLSCEGFLNDYIAAIKDGRIQQFRKRFRTADILLMDDIHFLSNKEGSQEEFFNTFNDLHSAQKQIVLSSDAPPNEIPQLEERIVSRVSWGLSAKIDTPTYETRVAILRKKAQHLHHDIPDDVLHYVASQIQNNIRQLEGAITTLTANADLRESQITLALAQEIVRGSSEPHSMPISVQQILSLTAQYYKLKVEDLRSQRWTKSISYARQVAIYLAKELTPGSLKEIGEHFGGKDHATVLYAINRVKENLQKDAQLKSDIEFLTRTIEKRS